MNNLDSSLSSNKSICFNTDTQLICLSVSTINSTNNSTNSTINSTNNSTNSIQTNSQSSNQNIPLVTQLSANFPGQFYGAPVSF